MKPSDQRIAIAEACGWLPDDDGDGTGWKGSWIRTRLIGKKPTFHAGEVVSYTVEQTVPDYTNDLNAMREAEKTIPPEKHLDFEECLERLISPHCPFGGLSFEHLHATAAQRAEALLKTLNIWNP